MSQGPTRDAKADTDMPELWQFVPLADYSHPEHPTAGAAVAAFASLRHLFRLSSADESPAKQENELRSLPEVRLEHLVRPIDWSTVSSALDAALSEQGDDSSAGPVGVRFVIGQPHCGHAEIVTAWASRHGAQLIAPPSHEELLSNKARWPAPWPAGGQRWAIARLERCFLRHANGLALVRRLLEDVAIGRAGTGLIGCDSWAWAYLQRVSSVPQPAALTLQAFDGPRLARLLSRLATPKLRQLHFRNARSGGDTLTVPHDGDSVSDEIVKLAAHCRGNFGTARCYWRQRLCSVPEPEADLDADGSARPDEAGSDVEVIWVSETLPEPVLPSEANEDVAIVLHALLLHNGLADGALRDVVPLPDHLCIAIVLRLQRQGLLERHEGRWIVSAPGYELVRQWLRGRGFLTDDF